MPVPFASATTGRQEANIDDRRFITFGLVHGLVRRVHEYAINRAISAVDSTAVRSQRLARGMNGMVGGVNAVGGMDVGMERSGSFGEIVGLSERDPGISRILPLLDGVRHVDDICTAMMRSHAELSMVFKAQPNVSLVLK